MLSPIKMKKIWSSMFLKDSVMQSNCHSCWYPSHGGRELAKQSPKLYAPWCSEVRGHQAIPAISDPSPHLSFPNAMVHWDLVTSSEGMSWQGAEACFFKFLHVSPSHFYINKCPLLACLDQCHVKLEGLAIIMVEQCDHSTQKLLNDEKLWFTCIQDNSYPRQLIPRTTRTQDNSFPGQVL